MNIIDLHCDVLEKLTRLENANFRSDARLSASLEKLKAGNVKVQVFAIFVHSDLPDNEKFLAAVRQIEALVTEGKIGNSLPAQCQRQTHPVVK